MKRLIASAVLLSATIVAPALFVGMSSTALAAGTLTVDWPEHDIDRYVAGMSYIIKWTPGNAGATVKIELLKAGKRTKWITKKNSERWRIYLEDSHISQEALEVQNQDHLNQKFQHL